MNYDYEDYGPEPPDHKTTLNAEVVVEWNNQAVIQAVIKQVSEMIYEDIKPQAIKAVTESLNDLANKAIGEMFDSEVQITDKWGKPLGPPISVRAMLQRDAEQWLMDVVDSNGRRGRDGYGNRHPRIHWLFEEALNGKKDSRGTTALQQMTIKAIKSTIGDVESVVNETVRAHVKAKLG